jgi:hypothetical protein
MSSRPPLKRSSVARRRAKTTGLWNSVSSTLVPSWILLVLAATQLSVSSGSYTLAHASGANIVGPAPPSGIGAVGRSRRSNVHTAARPMRSAPSAT